MGNDRSPFAINAHDSEFAFRVGIRDRLVHTIESRLHIQPTHVSFDEILNLIKRVTVYHTSTVSTRCGIINLGNMRQLSNAKTAEFHSADGGSSPTLTHQMNFEYTARH